MSDAIEASPAHGSSLNGVTDLWMSLGRSELVVTVRVLAL